VDLLDLFDDKDEETGRDPLAFQIEKTRDPIRNVPATKKIMQWHDGIRSAGAYTVSRLIHNVSLKRKEISVATVFSGCEVLKKFCQLMTRYWIQEHQTEIICVCVWCCDNDPAVQKHLTAEFNPSALFVSASHLLQSKAYDKITGKYIVIPHADVLVGGFVCTSRSKANQNSSENKGCLQRGEGKTGETYKIFRDIALKVGPDLVVSENLVELFQSADGIEMNDGDFVIKDFTEADYGTAAFITNAGDYGSLATRIRSYFASIQGEAQDGARHQLMRKLLTQMKTSQTMAEDILMTEEQNAQSQFETIEKQKKQKLDPEYAEVHLEYFAAEKYLWPVEPGHIDDVANIDAFHAAATQRQFEVVMYCHKRFPPKSIF